MGAGERAIAEEQVRQLIEELCESGDRQRMVSLLTDLYSQVSRENDKLRLQVTQLRDRLYGRKSEKLDPNQLRLALEELRAEEFAKQDEGKPDPGDAPARRRRKAQGPAKEHPGRHSLPEHLERIERRHTCSEEQLVCECCGKLRRRIREEVSERLDYRPASFVVIKDVSEVYACSCGFSSPVTASGPQRAIEGGIPEPGLLSKVTVAKYKDSCPLHRQAKIYERDGVSLSPSTMVGWIAAVAWLLEPLYRAINERVLRAWVVQSDDTGLTVLDRREAGGSRRGHIWANIGDADWIVYHYSPNWKHEHPQRFLKGVCGYLQTDGYAGYDELTKAETGKALAVGCWMHARRYFHKAFKSGDVRAALPIDIIQRMYKVERASKDEGEDPEARYRRRLEGTKPLLREMRAWLDGHVGVAPPKTPLGKAITYANNQWDSLQTFLLDGRLELDNGAVERALRGIAVGRKNWLFAGSDEGAERAAIIYTIIETTIRHGHEPYAYLRDVLDKLGRGWPQKQLDELLPDRWVLPDADAPGSAHEVRDSSVTTSASSPP